MPTAKQTPDSTAVAHVVRKRDTDAFRKKFNFDWFSFRTIPGHDAYAGGFAAITLDPESCPFITFLMHLSHAKSSASDYLTESVIDAFQTNLCDLYGGKHPQIIIGLLHTQLLSEREAKENDTKK